MRQYEITCLLSGNLSESEIKTIQERIISFIQKEEGLLTDSYEEKIIKRKLPQPIKKESQAYLSVFNFQMKPDSLENFKKNLLKENSILRFLILSKKPSRLSPVFKKVIKSEKKIYHEPKVELKDIEEKLEEILDQ